VSSGSIFAELRAFSDLPTAHGGNLDLRLSRGATAGQGVGPSGVRNSMSDDNNGDYLSQGDFEVDEAEGVLTRLEKEGIRFEIEMLDIDTLSTGFARTRTHFQRVRLYVHRQDLDAWNVLREKLYPV
jgi:hypothetical protein